VIFIILIQNKLNNNKIILNNGYMEAIAKYDDIVI